MSRAVRAAGAGRSDRAGREVDRARQPEQHLALVDLDFEPGSAKDARDEVGAGLRTAGAREPAGARQLEQ